MNNFIVSPQKDKQFKIWFRIALIAILLIYFKPLVFHIDSKDVTILGLKHILRSSWGNTLIYMFYWITFVWILGQLIMSLSTSMKWAKGSLWATLIFYVIHVLYSYIVPMPELGSPTLATYHLVGGVISTLYTASLILFGIHLVSRHGGRLKQLGIAILAWQLLPFAFSIFYITTNIAPISTWYYLATQIFQMFITIWVFYLMRQVFVPAWEETGKKTE